MARINFVPHRFSGKIGKIVEKAGSIIENYREKGYNLTLRQLHYRLCSYDYGIDYKNDEVSYKKLSEYIYTYSLEDIHIFFNKLSDLDYKIKSGRIDSKDAIELLIIDL